MDTLATIPITGTRQRRRSLRRECESRLRDDLRRNPLVRDHLKAENQYIQSVLADTTQTQSDLYEEMKQRVHEEDMSAPLRHD